MYLQEPFADCRHRPKSESERGSCTFRADLGPRHCRIFEKGGLLYPVDTYMHPSHQHCTPRYSKMCRFQPASARYGHQNNVLLTLIHDSFFWRNVSWWCSMNQFEGTRLMGWRILAPTVYLKFICIYIYIICVYIYIYISYLVICRYASPFIPIVINHV